MSSFAIMDTDVVIRDKSNGIARVTIYTNGTSSKTFFFTFDNITPNFDDFRILPSTAWIRPASFTHYLASSNCASKERLKSVARQFLLFGSMVAFNNRQAKLCELNREKYTRLNRVQSKIVNLERSFYNFMLNSLRTVEKLFDVYFDDGQAGDDLARIDNILSSIVQKYLRYKEDLGQFGDAGDLRLSPAGEKERTH